MGVLRSEPQDYYDINGVDDDGVYGNYRYIPLSEIIDSFNATYLGQGKILENAIGHDVAFHAIRGVQELSYDTIRCTKDLEVEIPPTLVLVMPLDYVNYVKLSWSDGNGVERIIYPTSKTSNAFNPTQAIQNWGGFTTGGLNTDLTQAADADGNYSSTTSENYSGQTTADIGSVDADAVDDEYGQLVGGRYGLEPQHAQANGSFYIDETRGKFHFSSNICGKTVVLRYISDGISSTSTGGISLNNTLVPKLAEEAIYKHMLYGILLSMKDSPAGLLAQIKKEKFAETRKAKLRLSNIKLEELTQILRGASKHIKH